MKEQWTPPEIIEVDPNSFRKWFWTASDHYWRSGQFLRRSHTDKEMVKKLRQRQREAMEQAYKNALADWLKQLPA